MIGRKFDLATFCAHVGASPKEANALRQNFVRGLKDYYEAAYGYDRYGAETIFMVPERMSEPYIFGFACRRILHDRRISIGTKLAAATFALDGVVYGSDGGIPYGFLEILSFLAAGQRLPAPDMRYGLVVSAGQTTPFRGLDRAGALDFLRRLLDCEQMPGVERLFWSHCAVARYHDASGGAELIDLVMEDGRLPVAARQEVCSAWLHFRQPQLEVEVPPGGGGFRDEFVRQHMPFWLAHSPSWPLSFMVRQALVWLPRLGVDPTALCEEYMGYGDTFADQVRAGVGDIIAEHHAVMPAARLTKIIERGIAISGSSPIRRRFYELGTALFGASYLERATSDSASSVRQWAARQKSKSV